MRTLFEIDASAFFQIITIVFNNPSVQYDFLKNGRSATYAQDATKISMSHKELIKRLSEFCNKLEEGSEERLQYLFFIASIAEDDSHDLQGMDFYQVTLELIKHHNAFLRFNKSLMQRQMTKKQMCRRLSRKGVQAPDKIMHVALSEESIMTLLR